MVRAAIRTVATLASHKSKENDMRRLAVLLALLALGLASCGTPAVGDAGPITPPAGAEAAAEEAEAVVAAGESATTAVPADSTTIAVATTTSAAASGVTSVKVYFFLTGGDSQATGPGPFLVPVHRAIPETEAVAGAAMSLLLAGPTADELSSVPGLSSTIPGDTMLLGIAIEDGLATVDLSREFESGGGSFSVTGRLAQVVYTLTQFPTVEKVAFELDGEPVTVFSGEGLVIDGPVGRDDYQGFLPSVFVDGPAYGAPAGNPLRVTGVGMVFEAQFNYALTDGDGLIIAEGSAMTDNGMGWGAFDFTIPYEVASPQLGSLIVFDYSAKDGTREAIREYPVLLSP
jgi:germination protein M